jgi:hypothetical protein
MRSAIRCMLLLCIPTMLYAQTPVRQPRFALEITEDGFPSRFVNVPEVDRLDSMFFDPSHHPLPAQEVANSEKTEPSAVELVCKVDGEAVAVTATVVFGPFDDTDTRLSLSGHPQQKIGTYSLHLDESIVLPEMEQFGLQPWTVKIVNAQMPNLASLPIVNEVPSIHPEILGKDREGYRVALRNLSSRAVTAFLVETTLDHNSNFQESNERGVVIAPGANHEFRLFCDTSASNISSRIAPDPAACAFILKAALFADGSYEGDANAAATMAALPYATQFQSRRVHELIDDIIEDSSLDDTSKLARVRSELPKLVVQPDPATLEQIQLRFPGLSLVGLGSVNASINAALASKKQRALRAFEEFEELPKQGPSSRTLTEWWNAWETN